jgi:glycosyltransferase involved in cell wall biosynthesis
LAIKVIHLISSLRRGGRERQLATILSHTDQSQFPSKIVYFNQSKSNYIAEYDLEGYYIHIPSTAFLLRMKDLYAFIKKENPDIIYTWGNLESIFTMLLSPFHHFRFINGSIRHGIRAKKISHYFRSFILHLSKNIVANSYAGLKANNLKRGQVLYNGIDDKFISQPHEDEKLAKKKQLLSLPEDTNVLISVANLVSYKDYFSILNSLKLIKEKGYQFHYVILGDGPLKQNLEQIIIDHQLSDNVLLLGSVQNVNEYLKTADIFIHSSKGEGCSNAILEAMASGLPVIASNTGGTPEIIDTENGFLFEYKNFRQLADLIMKCIDNKTEMERMGSSSIEKIKEKFTIDGMMQNYYGIISAVVK